jgi:dTDP-4-amino-4,6-dideoxygalactose transaminase
VVVDAAASFGVSDSQGFFGKGFSGCVVYSFHATKSFGIGEGGAVYSANVDLISQIRQSENFGFSSHRETTIVALNGKMSEYSAAIALSTLDVFTEKIEIRQKIYNWYLEEINQMDLLNKGWTLQKTNGKIPYQFMPICSPEDKNNTDITDLLAKQNIETRNYFSPPCHKHPLFKPYTHTSLSVTDKLSKRILSLPLWEEMTRQDIHFIVERMSLL